MSQYQLSGELSELQYQLSGELSVSDDSYLWSEVSRLWTIRTSVQAIVIAVQNPTLRDRGSLLVILYHDGMVSS